MELFIVFAPLVACLIAGLGWKIISEKAALWLTTGVLFLSCLLAWVVFLGFDGNVYAVPVADWIVAGDFHTQWSLRIDRLSAIMLVVVTSVSALVHLYSIGYMAHDDNWDEGEPYRARFFAYLSLFTFTMLMLVTANDILQLFFGWEGVGLASYLLIGFYYRKPSAEAAAIKAFVVNRVGDFCFLIGIFGLWWVTGSIAFDSIFPKNPEVAQIEIPFLWGHWSATNVIGLLLFGGAMGKSAQLGLHTWLPDAMEGPTPVSALIHAATMVTAGVFLVCRMSPIYEFAPGAAAFVVFIGAATAFMAATIGLVQNDIKRVIAYSTCSQLGYMFVAAGVGAYSVAMFHLFTHAFFKALLFLCSGSVITAMHHEQDMRNYGGLKAKMPITYWTMVLGTLSITGVGIPLTTIGFSGFLSKDAIIESAFASGWGYAFWLLVIAAILTSFYSWRLIFLTFHGKPRVPRNWAEIGQEEAVQPHLHGAAHPVDQSHDLHAYEHAKESPAVMTIPLIALAVGAVLAGAVWYNPFYGNVERVQEWFHMSGSTQVATGQVVTGEAAAGGTAMPLAADGAAPGTADGAAAGADQAAPDQAGADQVASDQAGADEAEAAAGTATVPAGAAIYAAPANEVIEDAHHSPAWVKVSPFIAMLIGFVIAWYFYIRNTAAPAALARTVYPLYAFFLNKWYFDEVQNFVVVRGGNWIARVFWRGGDGAVIDGVVNGVAMGLIPRFTRGVQRIQSGYIFHYGLAMVLGLVALLLWMTMRGVH